MIYNFIKLKNFQYFYLFLRVFLQAEKRIFFIFAINFLRLKKKKIELI